MNSGVVDVETLVVDIEFLLRSNSDVDGDNEPDSETAVHATVNKAVAIVIIR